ncbi:MAG: hypothetical protein AAF449_01210 [Myxococcota bacterium]
MNNLVYMLALRLRSILFPVALFGLVVLGLHAGSDRLDDIAFRLLHNLDRLVDGLAAKTIEVVLGALGVGERTISRWSYAAISVIDLEEKRWAARVLALMFEMLAAALLIWPVLRHQSDRTPWRRAFESPGRIRNIGVVFAPVAVACAGMAGAVVVAEHAQLQLFWILRFLGRSTAGTAAGVGALLMLIAVLFRLTLPAFRASLAFGRARASRGPWFYGWWLAAPLFIGILAVAPQPLWRALKGLGPW